MDLELQYLKCRAIEEREAAREAHLKLAEAFEKQADKIEHAFA